jgi:hypothetical protein
MKACLIVIFLLFASISMNSQIEPGTAYINDFNIIVTSLKEMHPALYTNIGKESFDKCVQDINQRLLATTSRFQAIYIIQELFYKLENSHAGNISVYDDLGITKALPFSVWIIDHDLYIKNYPADTTLNGTKIISIENARSAELIDSLKIFFPTDGNRNSISYNLQPKFNNLYGAFCRQKDTFNVQTEKGLIKMAAVQRGTELFDQLVLKTGTAYFGKDRFLKKEITNDYGYYKFIGFRSNFMDYKIEDGYNSFIKEANNKNLKSIIIDLRYNSGGDPYLAGRMTSYLSDHPFKVFQDIYLTGAGTPTYLNYMDNHLSYRIRHLKSKKDADLRKVVRFEKGFKTTTPSPDRFKGKIYIITGSITQSASTMMCYYLMGQKNVTFVGSEPIGAINYFWANSLCAIHLPALQTTFAFGSELIELKEGSSKNEMPAGLIPEHKIEYTIQDRIRGKDKEMEFIINDLKK